MSTIAHVLLRGSGRSQDLRAALEDGGMSVDVASETTAGPTGSEQQSTAYDCIVVVPEDDEIESDEIEGGAAPVVVYAPSEADAGDHLAAGADAVVRRGPGAEAAVVERIRTLTARPVTDGGAAAGTGQAELPLEQLHEIAADRNLSRSEKIEELLAAGAKRLGTRHAFLSHVADGTEEIVQRVGDHQDLAPGSSFPLEDAYCRYALDSDQPFTIRDAAEDGYEEEYPYTEMGLVCYLGATIRVDGEEYGTVCFVDTEPREQPFSTQERTFVEVLTDWISYLLEQQAYQRELDQQQAFTESLMNSLPDLLYAADESGAVVRWNDRFETVTGYEPAEIEGMDVSSVIAAEDRDRFEEALAAVWEGEQRSVEARIESGDDQEIPYEFSNGPVKDEGGEVTGITGVGRDITERQEHHRRLSGILDTTQSLMQARDREHVGEIAVNAARELLDFDVSVFRLYDGDDQTLEAVAMTDAAAELLGERPVYEVGESNPGEVFASGEPRVIQDLDDPALAGVRSVMYYPVGVHGTISVCSTEPDAFDETDEQMLALLATSAAAACMRAKREQDVREAREHTERVLDRVNGLVQNTVEVLVQATTREELEDGVVEQLAGADPYSFAWIGQPDVAAETLSPTAWAGEATVPIQGRSFDLSRGDDPVSRAYREATPQIETDLSNLEYGPWASIDGNEVTALIAIPLVYKDANYGVLSVFAGESDAFDERERVVLEAIGRVVANAINAIERGRILDATEIIELEFAIDDRELLFSRLSAATDSTIESVGTDYRSDGRVRLYLSATDVDAEELVALAEDDPAVESVTCIVEHDDECLLEVVVEESLLATLTEYGAVPREVVAENGSTRFTVELPYEAEAREVFELVEGQYPSTELLGYHERERPVETRQEFKAALSDRFTDRQETALRTAYLGGFFDWPREVDGNELAEAMDISRPTYHQHLRAAQHKVFEELFE